MLVGNEIWELAFYLLVLGPAWAIGMLLQRERSRSAELSRLAAELAAERELRTRSAWSPSGPGSPGSCTTPWPTASA